MFPKPRLPEGAADRSTYLADDSGGGALQPACKRRASRGVVSHNLLKSVVNAEAGGTIAASAYGRWASRPSPGNAIEVETTHPGLREEYAQSSVAQSQVGILPNTALVPARTARVHRSGRDACALYEGF